MDLWFVLLCFHVCSGGESVVTVVIVSGDLQPFSGVSKKAEILGREITTLFHSLLGEACRDPDPTISDCHCTALTACMHGLEPPIVYDWCFVSTAAVSQNCDGRVSASLRHHIEFEHGTIYPIIFEGSCQQPRFRLHCAQFVFGLAPSTCLL